MRRGKEIAQGSHASMSFLTKSLRAQDKTKCKINLSSETLEWLKTGQTKVCLKIDTEEELLELVKKAKSLGLEAHVIVDLGRTEFNGDLTITAASIGPNKSEEIDKLTSHLKLY